MRVRRHPSHQTLSRYVDEELTEARRAEVDAHLEGCLQCQREIDFMVEVQRGLREIVKPRPPRDVLEHVLERRDAGERIILPTAWASPRRLRPAVPAVAAGAAVLIAVAVGFLLLGNGEAAAGASALRFSPAGLNLSQEIRVEYTTAGALAAEPKLVLRGRYLTADDEIRFGQGGTYFSTELSPEEKGTFRGLVRLPGSVVYAQFAVEDEEGEHVDHNGYRSWDLLAEYEDGGPKFEALLQRSRVYQARDPQEAYESIRQLTERYPDRVEGWSTRYAYEVNAVASAQSGTLKRTHSTKFEAFRRRAAMEPEALSASELGALVSYARRLDNRAAWEFWADILLQRYPTDPIALRERVRLLDETLGREPRSLLLEYERVWEHFGPIQPLLLDHAYDAAKRARDESAIRRWAGRLVSVWPAQTRAVAQELAQVPSLRAFSAGLIRRELERLERASLLARPIHLSVSEYRSENRRLRHALLATLGRLLVDEGETDRGVDTLLLAAETGWDPELFAQLGELCASRGDVTTATRFLAMAAVDPLRSGGDLTAQPASISHVTTASSWIEALRRARVEYRDRINSTRVVRRPVDDVALRARSGAIVPLDGLLGESATVAFLWSRWARETRDIAQELNRYRELLFAHGIAVVAITRDADPEAALQHWQGLEVDLPVFVDPRGEAATALQSFSIPDLLVLDAADRIRFNPVDVGEAVRAALTLSQNG